MSPAAASGGRPRGHAVERSVEIAAPASAIWALVADPACWPRWNPVYPEAEGTTRVGDSIRMMTALPGTRPMRFVARVFVHEPERRLQFGASVLGGLLRATRYIELTPISATHCRVVNGEALGGLMGGAMMRFTGAAIVTGLKRAGEGLKRLAEADAPA